LKAGVNHALGIIETAGRAPLIEAVDSAIKAAAVTLKMAYFVGGGVNTVTLVGDVGAMRAALDAAKATIDRIGAVGQTHLIPRLAEDVWPLIMDQTNGRDPPPREPPALEEPKAAGDTAVKPSTPEDPVVQRDLPVPADAHIQTGISAPESVLSESVVRAGHSIPTDALIQPETTSPESVVQTEPLIPAVPPVQIETSEAESAPAETVGSIPMEEGTADKNGGEEEQGEHPDEAPVSEQEVPPPKKKSGGTLSENKPRKRNPKPKG
jgi:microcompartment protein CcmL/EutN